MDPNRIGMWIGIFALVLAVPLAVVANLLTPLVKNWYSTTSQERLRKRLAELTALLREAERQWTFTPAEWEIYHANLRMGILIFFFAYTVFALLPVVVFEVKLEPLQLQPSTHPYAQAIILATLILFSGFVINLYYGYRNLSRFRKARQMHTEVGREELRKQIKKLEAKKGELLIHHALYGIRGRVQCDVRKVLRDAVVDGKLHILVGNYLTGERGDPCPGLV